MTYLETITTRCGSEAMWSLTPNGPIPKRQSTGQAHDSSTESTDFSLTDDPLVWYLVGQIGIEPGHRAGSRVGAHPLGAGFRHVWPRGREDEAGRDVLLAPWGNAPKADPRGETRRGRQSAAGRSSCRS